MFLFISDTFWKIAIIHIRHLKMSIEYSLNKGIFPVFKQLIFLTRWQYLLKKGMFIGYFKMSIFFWTLFWWIVTVTYSEKNQIIISFKCHNKKNSNSCLKRFEETQRSEICLHVIRNKNIHTKKSENKIWFLYLKSIKLQL